MSETLNRNNIRRARIMKIDHVDGTSIAVDHALEVASMFAAGRESERESLMHLRVRRTMVEGTNGHILIQLPIHEQPWLTGYRYIAADAALIMAKSAEDCQAVLPTLPQEIEAFPNIDKTVTALREKPVEFECNLSAAYLETIGKAFGMLGITKIRMICRGKFNGVEFVGQSPSGDVGIAFQMPMK